MIHLCTAALAFNARSAVLSNVPRAHVSMADKAVEPSIFALPAGLAGKVVPTGAKGPGPTVSTNLLKSSGLDDAAKVNVALDMYESAGVSIAPSEGDVLVEGVRAITPTGAITENDVLLAQKAWANAIKSISKTYLDGGDYVTAAGYCAGELYGYGKSNVLFKPTKATNNPFRPDGESAMSYFVGSKAMNNPKFDGEDAGFAINGGKGWSNVVFRNHQVELNGNTAIAMGDYVFTDASNGAEVRVEYTFGYKMNDDGKMRIFLHHSSVPYSVAPAAITEEEVLAAQASWAGAIVFISSVYAAGGDYVGAAGAAAGELYGYGHNNVLFKPTKATKNPFRPTPEDAMSYFVGAETMSNEKFVGEDAGFAINGGKGWKNVVFRNHQIDLNSEVAIAMGDYVFTDATSGDEVRVEYTFGYKRCADGKPRIFLHHSSVPYQ